MTPSGKRQPVRAKMLNRFREISREVDFLAPLESLLSEYRRGNIADKDRRLEDAVIRSHLSEQHAAWDRVFPQFPVLPGKRRSITWEYYRGRRDAYLMRLVLDALQAEEPENHTIVNPAAVFGRHARWLAKNLPAFSVIATDIDPNWDRLYRLTCFWKYPAMKNYSFLRENVFEPNLERSPAAVTFFGACGSVTDGCIDYAIASGAPLLIFRSCCHDNIAGNSEIVPSTRYSCGRTGC